MDNKKGQAAMEFLMTYGWAILAAIVVIAVLAIYFRPSTLVSGSTFVTAPFYAIGSVVNASEVQLEVKNNGGEQVIISDMALTVNTPSTGAVCNGAFGFVGSLTLQAGQTVILTKQCNPMPTSGQFSADVAISYTRQGSSLTQKSTGSLAGSITA